MTGLERLRLDRPLAFFDLETTGTNTSTDRIVEIALLILSPSGEDPYRNVRRLNPGIPIPPEASEVHGITDEDVEDCPTFRQIARALLELLETCDLAGFNIRRFDLPLLLAEFERSGLSFDHRGRRIIDLLQVFHREEPRDLAAAVRLYAGEELEDAHSAEADTEALPAILAGQLTRYPHLPGTLDELHRYCDEVAPFRTEVERWFGDDLDAPTFQHGKHAGATLQEVRFRDGGYLDWLLRSDVDGAVKGFVRDFLQAGRRVGA